MDDLSSDLNVLTAMTRLTPELPELLGEIWAEVQLQIISDLRALQNSQDSKEQELIAERLIDVMSRSPEAQERLNVELHMQEAVKAVLDHDLGDLRNHLGMDDRTLRASLDATVMGLRWSLDPGDMPSADEFVTKAITMKVGGIGGAKSIKFRNLNLDFGELSAIAGGTILAGHEVIKDPNGLVIAASILMTIATLYKAATMQIDEQDASVFWGLIQVSNKKDNTANEVEIIESTNRERTKYRRAPLKAEDVRQSLTNLELLRSIASVGGHPPHWKLIERHTVKS